MYGKYQHSIDAKGRMIFPIKLREELGEEFVIFKGLDNCISVYSKENWEAFQEKISSLPAKARKMQRFYSDNTVCEPDAQGRILIPQSLREYAGLSKNVTVVGILNRAEIWDREAWKRYNSDVTSDDIAEIMDLLGV